MLLNKIRQQGNVSALYNLVAQDSEMNVLMNEVIAEAAIYNDSVALPLSPEQEEEMKTADPASYALYQVWKRQL